MNKINYEWSSMYDDTIKIRGWVKDVGFVPDGIIGLARGGVVPAAVLSHALNVPAHFVTWSTRDRTYKDTKKIDQLAVQASAGKKFIIVDDLVETGETIATIRDRMFDCEKNIVFVALWFNSSQTKARVHYHANVIERSQDRREIVFPWEFNVEDHPATEALGDG